MIEPIKRKPKVTGLEKVAERTGLRLGVPAGIKRVIAVHSGKGGVGKTFISVALAKSFAQEGLKVGLLDADIDCPNISQMLGLGGTIVTNERKKMVPLLHENIKVMSMGNIVKNEDQALLWRGPIVSRVVDQFVNDTEWGELDVLIVDLPPGTSDVPITVLQILRPCEVLLVTTGHELSVLDARKAFLMAEKTGNRTIGVIQNMKHEAFDDEDAVEDFLEQYEVPLLATVELLSAKDKKDFTLPRVVERLLREVV